MARAVKLLLPVNCTTIRDIAASDLTQIQLQIQINLSLFLFFCALVLIDCVTRLGLPQTTILIVD